MLRQFVENQTKELEIKALEIEAKKQEDNHAYEYALKAVDAEAVDRENSRNVWVKSRRDSYFFAGCIIVIVLLFLGFCLWIGKDAVAMEMIRLFAAFATGGLGGFAVGRYKKKIGGDGE